MPSATRAILFAAVLACLNSVHAQSAGPPQDFIQNWKVSKEFTLAVAGAMPADKYGFRPSPEEMPFAALMLHIAVSQAFRFAQISGAKMPFDAPRQLDKAKAKEQAIQMLTKSFDFCIDQLAKFTPEQIEKSFKVDWYERPEVTGRQLVLGMFTHTAHHRGQAEVYLRANGIKPPPYRF